VEPNSSCWKNIPTESSQEREFEVSIMPSLNSMLLWREYSVGFKVLKRYTKKGTKPLNWNKLKKKRRRKKKE
jgi:hypothetical protein